MIFFNRYEIDVIFHGFMFKIENVVQNGKPAEFGTCN